MQFFSIILLSALLVLPAFPADSIPDTDAAWKRIMELSTEIIRHNHLYQMGKPEISDAEYDRLNEELLHLEQKFPELALPDSPASQIGPVPDTDFPKFVHPVPMLSLDKCHSLTDLKTWISKTEKAAGKTLRFVAEEKIDGAAIELIYEKGILAKAAARGDGREGYDMTDKIRTIRTLPQRLSSPLSLTVRGEVFVKKTDFENLRKKGNPEYSSPRNLAAGALWKKDIRETAEIPLDIFVFEAVTGIPENLETHSDVLNWLKELGFPVNPQNRSVENFGDAEKYIREAGARRDSLAYETDGAVLKTDDLKVREMLGHTERFPRWAIAYKFSPDHAVTVLEKIEVHIGRLGRASPVAVFKPVRIRGAVICQATLHNQEYIRRLGLAPGDTIRVVRKGDVIPAVAEVAEKKNPDALFWQMPEKCPVCQTKLKQKGRHHICPNLECPARIREGLVHFAQKMGIKYLGAAAADSLIARNRLKYPEDIYSLSEKDLKETPGFSDAKIRSFFADLAQSRKKPFETVLTALGIPGLGKGSIRALIAAGFDSADKIMNASSEELAGVKGLGKESAGQIHGGFNPRMRESIAALQKQGLAL
ncbi:MAG: NAD-dependent DNA ligase LigA [Desulfococcaceae bacterium]